MDSTDATLHYLSIYNNDTGERETSYVVGIHGNTMDELKALAKQNYPDGVFIEQDGAEWNNAVQNDLIYSAGQLVQRPAPTEEELREENSPHWIVSTLRRFQTLKLKWQKPMPSGILIILPSLRQNVNPL